jgi:hypothetical protein
MIFAESAVHFVFLAEFWSYTENFIMRRFQVISCVFRVQIALRRQRMTFPNSIAHVCHLYTVLVSQI